MLNIVEVNSCVVAAINCLLTNFSFSSLDVEKKKCIVIEKPESAVFCPENSQGGGGKIWSLKRKAVLEIVNEESAGFAFGPPSS